MVAEHWHVIAFLMECGLEESRDEHLAHLTLGFAIDERPQVERAAAARTVVLVLPHRIPLPVVGAIHEDHRLEPRLAIRELQPFVLPRTDGRGHVTVVRAVDDQVVDVFERREHARRLVLPVHRRNRHHRLDVEVELELLLEIVRVVLQPIEGSGRGRRFPTTRMPHQRDPGHVHSPEKRSVGGLVKGLPDFQMLQQQPRAAIVLRAQAIDEVFIHRHHDESARRQQLTQVSIPRIRKLLVAVIAMNDEHQGKRPRALGIPDAPVEGSLLQVEAEKLQALFGGGPKSQWQTASRPRLWS